MDFYYSPLAATCRSILMIGKALGLEFNKIEINVAKEEHLKPEFAKLNPEHALPTIVDNGFVLWESRAILTYLIEKYGKDDSLYPKDPQKRAIVNQRLFFDMGTLYKALGDYYTPQLQKKAPADPELFKKVEEALGFLNAFLEGQKYVAGDSFTVADTAILATISSFTIVKLDLSKYANIVRWYDNCSKVAPGWEENEKGLAALKGFIEIMQKKA
ncbi:glutathione S-transferase D1-like [Drosophila sulfurigaster albostrigata]|uniref:glutathione S-transferase D1-like n=1 Tax=Drosophila sulfurigaster albostrigata TaxID=89887 RepID=UPI002D21C4D9|nr:glutathione S-transferase D1-like [Drosophila sulfurigaster albostrigata]